ncbi:YpdA family putative bacillithiol disulfide reductase [Arenibacter sp. TNZ]|jgi:thioredoxin reductase (NADPH)|uniref:YpdA family putative bacillithiol disulfide reductase n=1 Tax=Arenibacter TaxID=178469 RepID=UPI000CD3C10C|nr:MULTISPECIES: YpdA family putative bacillithiol disulfide reductase [Arenibacter]MCM4170176.1 YpdA family putative bacillithiol disulfide reductase [Arenibacter sp. TNZ]
MKIWDLVIVGGGPIGIACGLEAKKKGLTYIILEKGCIVNSLYNYPLNMQFFSSSEKLEIDEIPFISIEAKPKRNEALEYYRRIVTSNHLNISLFEKVNSINKIDGLFNIVSDKSTYQSNNVIISTGFYDIPNRMNVPGEDLKKVTHYYKDPHYYSNQKVAVIGASNSSVDAALECYRKGAEVSLIIRGQEVGQRVKYWVRPDIINRIEEGSIKVYYNSVVSEITEDEIILNSPTGTISLKNDYVLALTGYMPNFSFLEKIGIQLTQDEKRLPQYDPETMETNIENLYLAGVICGGMETHKWFIENSRVHAQIIIENIVKNIKSLNSKLN